MGDGVKAAPLLNRVDDFLEESAGGKHALEMGAVLAGQWNPVISNITQPLHVRMIGDLLAARPAETGFTLVAVSGKTLGSFLTGSTKLAFPEKGILYSKPMEGDSNKGISKPSGREWQRHAVHLKGVKFADFETA